MTNEIKEIIDYLKDKDDYIEELGTAYKRIFINNGDLKTLLDYITNLQEENRKLKELKYKFFDCCGDEESFTLKDYLELGNKLYDLQEENNELKQIIDIRECQLEEMQMNKTDYTQVNILEMQLEDYKTRNNKAVEYINKYEYQRYCPGPYEKDKYIMREEKEGQDLLNILQ